jgi:hypothetical protein
MTRDLRSITMASPKLFAMNATRWLSGEMSARSPKCVITSMFEGKCCRGSSGDLWPKGRIKQEDRMTAKVRTEKSYHPHGTEAALAHYEHTQSRVQMPRKGQLRISAIQQESSKINRLLCGEGSRVRLVALPTVIPYEFDNILSAVCSPSALQSTRGLKEKVCV